MTAGIDVRRGSVWARLAADTTATTTHAVRNRTIEFLLGIRTSYVSGTDMPDQVSERETKIVKAGVLQANGVATMDHPAQIDR